MIREAEEQTVEHKELGKPSSWESRATDALDLHGQTQEWSMCAFAALSNEEGRRGRMGLDGEEEKEETQRPE